MIHTANNFTRDLQEAIRGLSIDTRSHRSGPVKVCIVTPDFQGPIRNGGIGTIYTSMARILSRNGMQLTVLFTLGERSEHGPFSSWQAAYAEEGITLVPLPSPAVSNPNTSPPLRTAYSVYEWLKDKDFDFVHSPDWMGLLFYCLQAKEQGLALVNTCFVIGCHGPSLWNWQGNRQVPDSPNVFTCHDMERKCAEKTDCLISSSHHLVDWMIGQGWKISPERTFVQPNVFINPSEKIQAFASRGTIREVVFCGRLEYRKGIHIFCDAIAGIRSAVDADIKITFIGKPVDRNDFHSLDFISGKLKPLKLDFSVLTDMDSTGLINYFSSGDKLAVFASTGDNSPITMTEFFYNKIPFIASSAGGLPEMVHPEDRHRVLFPPTAKGLADKLVETLREKLFMPRPSYSIDGSNAVWVDWHQRIRNSGTCMKSVLAETEYSIKSVDITVCLIHHERPEELERAVAALELQSLQGFSVVVVDDGSIKPDTLSRLEKLEQKISKKGWRLIRQPNSYAGAARNKAASTADTDYLVFMDDDNIAKPHEIETMLKAINHSGADLLSCFADVFKGEWKGENTFPLRRLIFSGSMISNSLWVNTIGDANMIISKKAFEKIGGFHEKFGTGYEDYHFLVRAVLEGLKVDIIPEPLYWYRLSERRVREKHYSVDDAKLMILDAFMEKTPVQLRSTLHSAFSRTYRNNRRVSIMTAGRVIAQDGAHPPGWARKFYRYQNRIFERVIRFQHRMIAGQEKAYEGYIRFIGISYLRIKKLVDRLRTN